MTTVDDAFVRESTADARELSNALVEIEQDPGDSEAIESAFRVAHTLKGNCAAAGLSDAARLAHAVEDVLDAVGRAELEPTPELIDDALAAIDDAADLIQGAGRGDRPPVDAEARAATLRDRLDEPDPQADSGADAGETDAAAGQDTEGGSPDEPADIEFPEIPEAGQDLSAEEALDRASVFDDIDQLMAEMDDDAEEFADLGSAGTFETVETGGDGPAEAGVTDDSDSAAHGRDNAGATGDDAGATAVNVDVDADADVEAAEPSSEASAESLAGTDADTEGRVDADADPDETLDQSGNVGDVFDDIKTEVDDEDVDELESELAEVEFGEFDDDDDVSIDQLVSGDLEGEDLGPDATDDSPFGAVDGSDDATEAGTATEAPTDVTADVGGDDPVGVGPDTGTPARPRPDPDGPDAVTAPAGRDPLADEPEPVTGPTPRSVRPDLREAVSGVGAETDPIGEPEPTPPTGLEPRPVETDDATPAIRAADDPVADVAPAPVDADAGTGTGTGTGTEASEAVEASASGGFEWAETSSTSDDTTAAATDATGGESTGEAAPTPEPRSVDPAEGATPAVRDADEPVADVDPSGPAPDDSAVEPPDLPDLDELTDVSDADLEVEADAVGSTDLGDVDASEVEESVEFDEVTSDVEADAEVGDPDATVEGPSTATEGEVGEPDVDLDEFDLEDLDLDAGTDLDDGPDPGVEVGADPDAGVHAGAGTESGGVDDPDLPELGEVSPSSGDDSFEATFGDDETAAFESRFAAAFDEAEEAAAAESAATSANAALTIEESSLDGAAYGSKAADPAGTMSDPGGSTGVQTLSVDVQNAEELLNLAERLTVSRLRLAREIDPDNQAVEEALSTLESVASEFRTTVMDIRLMPLRRAVENLPRVVRDVARRSDVDVDFETEGTDVRLDRSVIDRISDPLVHVVRNAVDHGIESPEERRAAGKDPTGRVRLRAERGRQSVVVEVEDDGRGIDVEAVKAKAVEEGHLEFEEAEALTDDEVYEFLFRSGFSTAESVTETSGRGVGMDVVDRVLTELDGDVEIDSTVGEGTTVRLTLPVNVAMAEVWIVESGGERFAVPADPVDGIEDASGAVEMDGRELFEAQPVGVADGGDPGPAGSGTGARDGGGRGPPRDEPVPLIRLREAFDTAGDRNDAGMVLRLRRDVRDVAIHCDRVLDREEVVVKPYGELLGSVPGVSGATLRGDGRLVNVVDIETL
jgi:two-component system chemotaxis sensor kinase CheA